MMQKKEKKKGRKTERKIKRNSACSMHAVTFAHTKDRNRIHVHSLQSCLFHFQMNPMSQSLTKGNSSQPHNDLCYKVQLLVLL